MEVFKIDITSWTASFRYPNLMTVFHPTLEAPPISTILGLINAAAGRYIQHQQLQIGYYFEYASQEEDIETIYKYSTKDGALMNRVTAEPFYRKFLTDAYLRLYITDAAIANMFRQPHYQLLLGRMNDLATVERIESGRLEEVAAAQYVRGQVVPFIGHRLPGQIQPLPLYFTDTLPRQNIGTAPFSIISAKNDPVAGNFKAYRDEIRPGEFVDIFFHQLDFSKYD